MQKIFFQIIQRNKKEFIVGVFLFILSSFCFSEQYSLKEITDRIQKRGEIICLTITDSNYPYLYKIKSLWQGKDIDFIEGFSRLLNVSWRIEVCDSITTCIKKMEDNQGDLLLSGTRVNLQDAFYLQYSDSIAETACYLLVNQKNLSSDLHSKDKFLSIEKIVALPNGRVGFTDCTASISLLDRHPNFQPVIYSSFMTKIDDLINGKLSICYTDSLEIKSYFKGRENLFLPYRLIPVVNKNEKMCYAVYWKDSLLLDLINIELINMNQSLYGGIK